MNATDKLILSCIDGSSVSDAICDYSRWIASRINMPVRLLHTIEHSQNPAVSDFSGAIGLGSQEELLKELTEAEQNRSCLLIKKGQLMLDAAKERIAQAGIKSLETSQLHGSLVESLIELENNIGILVIGIRGESHEEKSAGIGSQLVAVIRSLHKPILVVNKTYSEPKKIMLAYDGSQACRKALSMVASNPLFHTIPCHIVHIGDNGQTLLDEASKILTKAGIQATTMQLTGKVDELLPRYQADNKIDLTVMGAFSHNRLHDFLLGSFTTKMLEISHCPLLLLR